MGYKNDGDVKKIILGFTLLVVMGIIYSKYLNKTSEPNRQNNRSDINASSEIKRKQNEAEQRKKDIESRSREFARAHNLRDMSFKELWYSKKKKDLFKNFNTRKICNCPCLYEQRNRFINKVLFENPLHVNYI
jgi:hypothetical protein